MYLLNYFFTEFVKRCIIIKTFSFCNWNCNSIAKDNFSRVDLLKAQASIYNYDIISLCETLLNDDIDIPESLIDGYKFEVLNHPGGTKRGGVGIFYKDTLPLKIRHDISFNECLVCEIHIGKRKVFYSVCYRSPSMKANTPEFEEFLTNFGNLYANVIKAKPYACFFTGDFNAHSLSWRPNGSTDAEGFSIENLLSSLDLTQLIREPTNFEENKSPSCIDLIICDQSNIVMESGVRPSPDNFCKHQIIFCNLNLHIPTPPSHVRKIWHYNRADSVSINKAVTDFQWLTNLSNCDPSQQVEIFNDKILNIASNFIPNNYVKIQPKDPPWLTNNLRRMITKQNKQYKKFVKNGCLPETKVKVDKFRNDCFEAINLAKSTYLDKMGTKLLDSKSSPKAYWQILNKLINKCRIPRIPPLLLDNKLVICCKEKARLFNTFFLAHCKPNVNASVLPVFSYLTNSRLGAINFTDDEVKSLILSMNPNKSHGCDNISIQLLQLCAESVAIPLGIIFKNIIKTGVFPTQWKYANVTPIHKKGNKQFICNYRPISLLPVCSKIFEKFLFSNVYKYLIANNLISEHQSGFRPGDSTTNQLLYLVHTIHLALDEQKEVRSVFLDISKAFDKVWHVGLLFKLQQIGIDGILLKLFKSYLSNRNQRVVINGFESEWGLIEAGVPQGSVLGPHSHLYK